MHVANDQEEPGKRRSLLGVSGRTVHDAQRPLSKDFAVECDFLSFVD